MLDRSAEVGIVGAGSMGSGIAQVAALAGHRVIVCDANQETLARLKPNLQNTLTKLQERGKITAESASAALEHVSVSDNLKALSSCGLVIEAVVENLEIKKALFQELEATVSLHTVLATNTSSLSVTAIAGALKNKERCLGVHFFNPAPLMPLVEIVSTLMTSEAQVKAVEALVVNWGKTTVRAKDTPGFIVNRIARPFYGEALRLLEEGVADVATIDWAMKEFGGFRMGPFELMDLIGNDINYAVTESVFAAFYFDPRYRPSITQRRMVEGGLLGKKSGRGYYDYASTAEVPQPRLERPVGELIFRRILAMLINEAADAVFLGIASAKDIDTAMTKGVNYPKGLLEWADEIGLRSVQQTLDALAEEYREDRYRLTPLIRRKLASGEGFYG